jgi:hypothetical protein
MSRLFPRNDERDCPRILNRSNTLSLTVQIASDLKKKYKKIRGINPRNDEYHAQKPLQNRLEELA